MTSLTNPPQLVSVTLNTTWLHERLMTDIFPNTNREFLRIVMFFQVLGLTTPAYKGGVMEGDVLVSVEDTLVTLMKHAQVKIDMNVLSVSCVKCYSNSHKR